MQSRGHLLVGVAQEALWTRLIGICACGLCNQVNPCPNHVVQLFNHKPEWDNYLTTVSRCDCGASEVCAPL